MHGRRYMDMRNWPWWCSSLHKFRWSENHMEYIWTTLPWYIAYIALKDSALHLFRCGLWKQIRKPLSSGSKTMCVTACASEPLTMNESETRSTEYTYRWRQACHMRLPAWLMEKAIGRRREDFQMFLVNSTRSNQTRVLKCCLRQIYFYLYTTTEIQYNTLVVLVSLGQDTRSIQIH